MTATCVDDDDDDDKIQAFPAQDELRTCRASLAFLLRLASMNIGRQLNVTVTVTPEPS